MSPIKGTFDGYLKNHPEAPCWVSSKTPAAQDLQKALDNSKNGDYKEVDAKIKEYMKDDHFFKLTEGKFFEVTPGDYKPVTIRVQVKEGTITWYFEGIKHDESTQEFRNQVFRPVALGHLLVNGACKKYLRGTNAMHIKRMHTSQLESMSNHNHYRVHDDHVTPAQFEAHLKGFLKAQEAYGIKNKFITEEDVKNLSEAYAKFDAEMDKPVEEGSLITKREAYHLQEQSKWTELDKQELAADIAIEQPCEAQEVIIPLNEKQITLVTKNAGKAAGEKPSTIQIFPKEWDRHLDVLDRTALDILAKEGSAGLKAEVAHTRQLDETIFKTQANAYTKLGELFDKVDNSHYPRVDPPTENA